MISPENKIPSSPETSLLKNFSLRLVIALGLVLMAFSIFWFIIHEVIWEKEENVDKAIMAFLSNHIHPQLTGFMEAITFLASSSFLFPAYLVLVVWYLFLQKEKIIALNVAAIGATGFLLTFLLKKFFRRNRPIRPLIDTLNDYSFPSGHTTSGFIFYGLLIYLIWKSNLPSSFKYSICILLFLLSLMIGISRVYLRMHYPTDVIAGFCLGFSWLIIALFILNRLDKRMEAEKCI